MSSDMLRDDNRLPRAVEATGRKAIRPVYAICMMLLLVVVFSSCLLLTTDATATHAHAHAHAHVQDDAAPITYTVAGDPASIQGNGRMQQLRARAIASCAPSAGGKEQDTGHSTGTRTRTGQKQKLKCSRNSGMGVMLIIYIYIF